VVRGLRRSNVLRLHEQSNRWEPWGLLAACSLKITLMHGQSARGITARRPGNQYKDAALSAASAGGVAITPILGPFISPTRDGEHAGALTPWLGRTKTCWTGAQVSNAAHSCDGRCYSRMSGTTISCQKPILSTSTRPLREFLGDRVVVITGGAAPERRLD